MPGNPEQIIDSLSAARAQWKLERAELLRLRAFEQRIRAVLDEPTDEADSKRAMRALLGVVASVAVLDEERRRAQEGREGAR